MGDIFAITSGKGGVGKSTLSVGLGSALCECGKKVLLVDVDEGLRCLDLMLGLVESTVFDLSDILAGAEIESAIYKSKYIKNLYLIPAPAHTGTIDPEKFSSFILKASDMFDFVILDFPAGINLSLYSALPSSALFLIVAVPDAVSVRDAYAVGNLLKQKEISARLVINRFLRKQPHKYRYRNIDYIIDDSSLRLIGIVPEDTQVKFLSVKNKINRRSAYAKACMRIAKRLMGEKVLLPKIKKI